MRWQFPKHGTKRIKSGFTFVPKILLGELRWLEHVKIHQVYREGSVSHFDSAWHDITWAN